jgi:hypothetical protein
MKTHRKVSSVLGAFLLVTAAIAGPGKKTARAQEIQARKLGVGYKIGNGIGFAGGDVVLRLIPHVVFDLQASYASAGGMTGYGLAPTVQLQLNELGHTPYLGAGIQHANLSDEYRGGYATGFVVNAGYEWRFASGVGVLVGGGIQDLGTLHVTKGTATGTASGGAHLNLEAGVRYFF